MCSNVAVSCLGALSLLEKCNRIRFLLWLIITWMINTFLGMLSGDRRSDTGLMDRSVQRLLRDEMVSKQACSGFFSVQSFQSWINYWSQIKEVMKQRQLAFFKWKCMFELCTLKIHVQVLYTRQNAKIYNSGYFQLNWKSKTKKKKMKCSFLNSILMFMELESKRYHKIHMLKIESLTPI